MYLKVVKRVDLKNSHHPPKKQTMWGDGYVN